MTSSTISGSFITPSAFVQLGYKSLLLCHRQYMDVMMLPALELAA
jgi:hypothetical protein